MNDWIGVAWPLPNANRGVAQLGRALPSGGRSRRFESFHPDQIPAINQQLTWLLFYVCRKSSTPLAVLQFFGLHGRSQYRFPTILNSNYLIGLGYGSIVRRLNGR